MSHGKKPQNTSTFIIDFLAGGISGSLAKTIAAPVERVKLLLQTQAAGGGSGKQYTGIFNCLTRVIKEEGVPALWRGNFSNIIRYFPTQAINFSVKDQLNRIFCRYDPKTEPTKFFVGKLLSGGCAGAIGLLVVYPLDFARTRLGADRGRSKEDRQFTGTFDCLKKVYKQNGIKGIYGGFGISVLGIFVYRALYFGVYDSGKKIFLGDDANIPFWKRYLFAQVVTTGSETMSYPIDTVRRRLMMQAGKKEKLYNGTLDCAAKIYKKEGVYGFFKGSFSNIVRSVGSSLVLVLYDEIQKAVKKQKNKGNSVKIVPTPKVVSEPVKKNN